MTGAKQEPLSASWQGRQESYHHGIVSSRTHVPTDKHDTWMMVSTIDHNAAIDGTVFLAFFIASGYFNVSMRRDEKTITVGTFKHTIAKVA
jgi:hypothetical protein